MATYYLKLATDGGNDSLAGTSPSTAWATWAKALGATGITGGDTLYVAPGVYNITSTVTIGGTYSTASQIIGDSTASQFPGFNAGVVVLTGWNAAKTTYSLSTNAIISSSGKSNLTFKSINFNSSTNVVALNFTTAQNIGFEDCVFTNAYNNQYILRLSNTGGALNASIKRCVFVGGTNSINIVGNNVSDTSVMQSTLFTGFTNDILSIQNCGISIYNCSFINNRYGVTMSGVSGSFPVKIYNCMFANADIAIFANVGSSTTEDYNRICNVASPRTNVTSPGSNTTTTTPSDLEFFQVYKAGLNFPTLFANTQNNINKNFGTASGAPATDLFNVAWTGTTPDAGAITYNPVNLVAPTLVYNGGNERNASTITIAPASTSQSIELYLGATGLTFATSGLAAYYVRNREAPTPITLVTQTPTGAWASGGFAEISSSLVPGVYRLDVPDAAFAAGASDVTIVVRGAAGTNGAVLTVTLSSGGLTAAQTAAAVWDEPYTSHVTASTFGARTLKTVADNRLVNVGTANHIESNVHAVVNSTAAASELSGALLHNGTDYISAELVTPVTSAALVRMGPFEVRADGLGASDPLDIQTGAQHGIDIQCVDNNGAGIDITSATVTAKVYNSGATLVDTYACTATYAADGRATFTIDTTVTNVPGTYTATITRTTGASDTQVFGPLRIYVRDI
jgi:hypothetical protein